MTNEAMLTGESVPQIKESLALLDQEQIGKNNKLNVMICGNKFRKTDLYDRRLRII